MAGAIVAGLAAAPVAIAHRGHAFGSPFHEITLSEACALAGDEHKLVFAYVTAPGRGVPAYLERPTWAEWQAVDLLIRETVAVRLDGRAHAESLAPYKLDAPPAMLLLERDGRLLRALPGDLGAARLRAALVEVLSDPAALARVRAAVAQDGPEDPLARERLAETLVRHGQPAEGLAEYVWCVQTGLAKDPIYAKARRRLLYQSVLALAEHYPAARTALVAQRDAMERELLDERFNPHRVHDLAELNRCLEDEARSLALFDRLPEHHKVRHVLFDYVVGQLVAQQRYDEVLAIVDPLRAFREEARIARIRQALWDQTPDARTQRGTRDFAVARGGVLLEALIGARRDAEARQLVDAILRFDGRAETVELLRQHARADAAVLAYLASQTSVAEPP